MFENVGFFAHSHSKLAKSAVMPPFVNCGIKKRFNPSTQ
jgi:hypothetical protein